jgi:hypothetical protein
MSLEELRRLDFGGGEQIPELCELLAALPPARYLDLELKEETITAADCGSIAEILDARIHRQNLMVSSFAPQLLMPFRRRGFTVGFLVGNKTVARGLRAFACALVRLRPHYLNLPIQLVQTLGAGRASLLLRLARLLGFSLLFWTVNTGDEAAQLGKAARIIVTDHVDRLVRFRDQSAK